MDISNLEKILEKEPPFRSKQAKEAVFAHLIENWSEATNLPKEIVRELEQKAPLNINALVLVSKKGDSAKAAITLKDGIKVEIVIMRHDKRNTVCVSSQAGCPLGCLFCATGKEGFKRNLETMEIIEQLLFCGRYLKKTGEKINNIVFMGMGEPFLNYDNVFGAIKMIAAKDGFNIGSRHISISTAGITEGILKMAQEPYQVNLAISLHSPNDNLRRELMPVAKKYSIKEILGAVDQYILSTRRKVMFEYIMIKDFNDSDDCARELARLLKKPLYFVNLISYNPTGNFEPSSPERIKSFKDILMQSGIQALQRYRFGEDIEGACGQLAGKK